MFILYYNSSAGGSVVKNRLPMQETQEMWVWSLGQEDPLEKKMATHSAGSQCEESHPWQGHEEGSWHTQGVLRLQGPLWKFLSMYPNKNLPVFVLCFSTLLTFSGKSQFRALVFCIWKSVWIQKPSDGFLACLQDSYSCACDCLRPPDRRRHRKLKTS